jgi:hypothetical protein
MAPNSPNSGFRGYDLALRSAVIGVVNDLRFPLV